VGRWENGRWRFGLDGPLRHATRVLLPAGDALWLGTSRGAIRRGPGGDTLTYDQSRGLASDLVTDLHLQGDRRLWALTDQGLSVVRLR
jgi:ligand-binding sensor domain-containing protein